MLVRGTPIIAATNAQNGVIYVISKVMAEETKSTSLLEELEKESDVSIFNGYIKRSAWLRKLQGKSPVTPVVLQGWQVIITFILRVSHGE